MIEEAAGTRMYENKKLAALKTIQKKQLKVSSSSSFAYPLVILSRQVDEINKVLAEDILPTLDKLRKEKTAYMQWMANRTEIDRLER